MVGFISGPTRWDPTCYGKVSLPHWSVSSMPSKTERYFSSGNERSPFRFEAGGNTGYHLGEGDVISWVVDLMNMYVPFPISPLSASPPLAPFAFPLSLFPPLILPSSTPSKTPS